MTTVQISKPDWKTYFDRTSQVAEPAQVEIEVSSPTLGNQIATDWTPLHGLSYDPKNDILAVFLDGMEHMIHHPQQIFIEQEDSALKSMEVLGDEDTRHIIRLRSN